MYEWNEGRWYFAHAQDYLILRIFVGSCSVSFGTNGVVTRAHCIKHDTNIILNYSDQGLDYSLTESLDTTECMNREQRPR